MYLNVYVSVCLCRHATTANRSAIERIERKNENGVRVFARNGERSEDRERVRESQKKKCVLHAKNQFMFSVALARKHFFPFHFILFLSLFISISFALIPFDCRYAVCFDISIPRSLNHKFTGVLYWTTTQNHKSKRP